MSTSTLRSSGTSYGEMGGATADSALLGVSAREGTPEELALVGDVPILVAEEGEAELPKGETEDDNRESDSPWSRNGSADVHGVASSSSMGAAAGGAPLIAQHGEASSGHVAKMCEIRSSTENRCTNAI